MIAGFEHHNGYLGRAAQVAVLNDVRAVLQHSPLYQPTMPKTGKPLSVSMSNCGSLGWLTDKDGGYRYQATHPATGDRWSPIPASIMDVWRAVLGNAPEPEACLINWYGPGAKLGLHKDADEDDQVTPVVSISLGDDAWFRIGGLTRTSATNRVLLRSGDVAVLGGEARRAYHGIDRIMRGSSDLLAEPGRFNLTLRRVTPV
ncbi:MAG: alpha-ketoglutarate-dependent dioxygenase AlkB [Pseudomonadota bacterium]